MTKSPSEIVSEQAVHTALKELVDGAHEIGQLTTDARFAESWVRVAKAVAMKHSGETGVGAQEREALACKEYEAAIREEARTAGELAKAKALREAAALKIEVWRTQSSNWRSMKV